ncbi:MAG: hormogonium polysaccharide biosynthesis glycosyltransferase HpsE [Aulosira sp. ZfuVER01]|nr:hormogonium polysaccharide biosynthesis glycosyltransferase HpsE [Aulosira sp. ZfuVER01]MDZ7999221.1 hormogonium polysaccharide biosynthesis glycosyltransferase HpsE [Aulosira sp. DedVER01a]MDZ8051998.1 hormogonium polysaccharide biosynthesis glycosyltransferase HpsE [Aulosira sp. ZfuCHP01]
MTEIVTQSLDITVAIPTYNGAERLPKLLDQLLAQTGVEHLNWEIIVVDNNSCDRTEFVVNHYQTICNNICPLRYFLETKQGAAFARIRAVYEARGQLVAFLDDDNLPAPDWLIAAYNFGSKYPQAGAWSGQIHANYEVSPPHNFERIQAFLAIREQGDQPYLFDADNLRLPPGAALVVRKQVWYENVPKIPTLSGKLPGVFVQGDDYEPLLYIHNAGWEIWYNPAMHTYHQIPHWRLEKNYLLSLARGCGLCIFHLRLIKAKNWQKPIIFIKTFFGSFYRIFKHYFKYKSTLKTDIIALFELEFYLGTMISPFYYLKCFFINSYKSS